MGWNILLEGGFVLAILAALSVYTLAVIAHKLIQFQRSAALKTQFIEPVMQKVKQGEYTDAETMLAQARGPVARIMLTAIRCVLNRDMSIKSRESEIARVGSAEVQTLESHMRGLEMVSNTAPLLGLLGTVMGMIAVFATLSQEGGRVDPALLAEGIWQALVTTVGGLFVGIPAIAAYYLLDSQIEKVRTRMRDVSIQILALEDVFMKNEREQERREMINQHEALRHEKEHLQKLNEEQRQLQEAHEQLLERARTTAQSSGTLRLLNPSYRG